MLLPLAPVLILARWLLVLVAIGNVSAAGTMIERGAGWAAAETLAFAWVCGSLAAAGYWLKRKSRRW